MYNPDGSVDPWIIIESYDEGVLFRFVVGCDRKNDSDH